MMLHSLRINVFAALLGLLVSACSTFPPAGSLDREASYAIDDPARYPLGQFMGKEPEAREGQSAFQLLEGGTDALLLRLALVESAEKTLDLQYYIFRDDDTGFLLAASLLRRADEGVRVRLLVDDVGMKKGNELEALYAHPSIEIRRFNPMSQYLGLLGKAVQIALHPRLNHRMHNKAFVADNAAAIVGGRNIGDKYFDADGDRAFMDLELLTSGPVVQTISRAFDTYWNSDYAYPLGALREKPPDAEDLKRLRVRLARHDASMYDSEYMQAMRRTPLSRRLRNHTAEMTWARAEFIVDSPDKVTRPVESNDAAIDRLTGLIRAADEQVVLTTPYLVPSPAILTLLIDTAKRGVEIRVVTNSFHASDLDLAHAAYMRSRPALVRNGVELFEIKPDGESPSMNLFSTDATLHAKSALIDGDVLVIGSVNIDSRSFYLNTETLIVVHSPSLVDAVAARVKVATAPSNSYRLVLEQGEMEWITEKNGEQVRFRHEPRTGLFQRFYLRLLSYLPLRRQL